ncbi:MAG TPA: hypothetical protein VJ124_01745 [Pyrinomonadaceae bacterium]|nr:hypothetical protein [Pyrinomonadaceae bacterium]
MNTKPLIRRIKKEQRQAPEIPAGREFAPGPNKWSKAVLSWVTEFRQHRSGESLPAFDSLFKALPEQRAQIEI